MFKYLNKGFSTTTGILIIVLVVLVFGGILGWQYKELVMLLGESPLIEGTNITRKKIKDLPIVFAAYNNEELIDYFNQVAKKDDFLVFHEITMQDPNFEELVDRVKKGQIVYNFPSWQRAEANVNYLKDKVDCFAYDLELWEKTPEEERQDISYSSQQMARVTHENGLCYIGALSYKIAERSGTIEDMAEFTDIYGPHSFRHLIEGPEDYPDYLRQQAQRARAKNPDVIIEIMVSVSSRHSQEDAPDVETLYNIINNCLDFTDRVAIFHSASPKSINELKQLISLMRPWVEI